MKNKHSLAFAKKAVETILKHIGENPERAGLQGTPERVVRMWEEMYRGYNPLQAPKITTFKNGSDGISTDQLITDSGSFYSTCEHHMLPFFGRYVFGYIPSPDGQVIGLSKVARVVDYHAAKLQIQERLGADIVEHLLKALTVNGTPPPIAIGIFLEAEHLCKTMRGVRKQGKMSTTMLHGAFLTDDNTKFEFINHCK